MARPSIGEPSSTATPATAPKLSLKWAVVTGLGLGIAVVLISGTSAPGSFDPSTIAPSSKWEEMGQEYPNVGFDMLAGFNYGSPNGPPGVDLAAHGQETIPANVRALSGRRVSVTGFMLPLDFDGDGVTEFILNANYDMCYFGAPTRPNDFIVVRMRDGRRTRFVHTPVIVFGALEVGEERQGERLVSLYRMTGDAIGVGAVP